MQCEERYEGQDVCLFDLDELQKQTAAGARRKTGKKTGRQNERPGEEGARPSRQRRRAGVDQSEECGEGSEGFLKSLKRPNEAAEGRTRKQKIVQQEEVEEVWERNQGLAGRGARKMDGEVVDATGRQTAGARPAVWVRGDG